MLLLVSTSDKIQVVTAGAGNIDVHASFVDLTAGVTSYSRKNTQITTATTTDVVASPSASAKRNVRLLTVRNRDTVGVGVIVQHTNGSTVIELAAVTLAAGQSLVFDENIGFRVVTPPVATVASTTTQDQAPTTANTAEMLVGSVVPIVVGHPIRIGTVFRWRFAATKTALGTTAFVTDVRFGATGTPADTSRLNLNWGVQTAVVDALWAEIRVLVRGPLSGACIVEVGYIMWHNLDTTGFRVISDLAFSDVSAAFDITTVKFVGLSITQQNIVSLPIVTAATFNL